MHLTGEEVRRGGRGLVLNMEAHGQLMLSNPKCLLSSFKVEVLLFNHMINTIFHKSFTLGKSEKIRCPKRIQYNLFLWVFS
jgi:hypothetical protein